jgi:hypothetical protein
MFYALWKFETLIWITTSNIFHAEIIVRGMHRKDPSTVTLLSTAKRLCLDWAVSITNGYKTDGRTLFSWTELLYNFWVIVIARRLFPFVWQTYLNKFICFRSTAVLPEEETCRKLDAEFISTMTATLLCVISFSFNGEWKRTISIYFQFSWKQAWSGRQISVRELKHYSKTLAGLGPKWQMKVIPRVTNIGTQLRILSISLRTLTT